MKPRKELSRIVRFSESIQTKITEMTGSGDERFLKFTQVSGTVSLAAGTGKLVLGILTASLSSCVSACCTFGMAAAKSFALAGSLKAKNKQEQYRYCFISGAVLILTSLLFAAYSVRIAQYPAAGAYNIYAALAAAVFTFAELALSIRGVLAERSRLMPPFYAVKMINLASSLLCLVLAQTAILSAADAQSGMHQKADGMLGAAAGCSAAVIGIVMTAGIRRIQTCRNYRRAFRKVKKLMISEGIIINLKPVLISRNTDSGAVLYVTLPDDIRQEQFDLLCADVNERLQLQLKAVK